MLDNIELGLELLTIYGEWAWTRRLLDEMFLPMFAKLISSSALRQQSVSDDSDVTFAQVMLGIMGNVLMYTFLTRCTQREQTSAEHGNPEDPDFGLWTPGSEA